MRTFKVNKENAGNTYIQLMESGFIFEVSEEKDSFLFTIKK